jgi:ParB-like chromosome segregation protein Spo0J
MQTELLEQHPLAAKLIPPMPPTDLRDLANDIKEQGQRHPCLTYEGKIIVGWSRYTACIIEQIEPLVVEYRGDDPVALIASEDLHRRHMGPADRKKVAKALLDAHPEWSNRRIAHESGFNRTDVGDLRREVDSSLMSGTDINSGAARSGNSIEKGDAASPESHPEAAPDSPEPVQRVVGTTKKGEPRKAPGRKPLTAAEKNTRNAAKPASVLGNQRDKWIYDSHALFNGDLRQAMTDLANIAYSYMGPFQQQASEAERREWLKKCAKTAGFERAFAEVFSDF